MLGSRRSSQSMEAKQSGFPGSVLRVLDGAMMKAMTNVGRKEDTNMAHKSKMYSFVKELRGFTHTLSCLDREWGLVFPDRKGQWRYLHVTQYKKTFYVGDIDGDCGVLEIEPGKGIWPTDPMGTRRRHELADDPEYSTIVQRLNKVPKVDEIVESWSKTKTSAEVMAIFKEEGLACGTVQNVEVVSKHPHSNARDMLVEVQQPQMGPVKIPGCPINYSETPVRVNKPAPLVGENTKEILYDFLGYSEEEIQKFQDEGVF